MVWGVNRSSGERGSSSSASSTDAAANLKGILPATQSKAALSACMAAGRLVIVTYDSHYEGSERRLEGRRK